MTLNTKEAIKLCFNCVCIFIVSIMAGLWFYKYAVEDRDIGVVSYELLKEAKDIKFPAVSLCFKDPYINKKLQDINISLTQETYLRYLKGEYYDEQYGKIDYENVTIDLGKYFLFATTYLRNETRGNYSSKSVEHPVTFSGFYQEMFLKCFWIRSYTYPPRNLKQAKLYYDKKKLMSDWQLFIGSPTKLYVVLHYQGQFFLYNELQSSDMTNKQYARFAIKDFEILKQRNKRRQRCIEDTNEFDNIIYEEYVTKAECTVPYINENKLHDKCKNGKGIYENKLQLKAPEIMEIPKACTRISKIRITKYYGSNRFRESALWYISISYPREVKIITQSKEVDFHALIGNIGGYLGLFLGNDFL